MPRRYALLLPPGGETTTIALRTPVLQAAGDPRPLGIRLAQVDLRVTGARGAPLADLLASSVLLLVLGALLVRAGAAAIVRWTTLAALVGLVGFASWSFPLVSRSYLINLATAALLLALLTWLLLPRLEALNALGVPRARVLWQIALLACELRLIGVLFPLFGAYDLDLNLGRLLRVATGTLVATNESFEFRGGVTVYPPGPYLALLPGLLAGITPKLLVQGGIAIIDGLSVLGTAGLALALGAGWRTARIAALLHVALPISLTSLWYGHAAQSFGQALITPLALLLLVALRRGGRWPWIGAGVLLSMALLSHIGVTILAVAWLGLAWLPLARTAAGRWRAYNALLVVAGMIGLVFVYGPTAALKLRELGEVGAELTAGGSTLPAYPFIWRAFTISYYALGWQLLLPGLLLLPRIDRSGRILSGAWVIVVVIFWGIEMLSALQVRYMIFVAPLACLLIARPLAALEQRGAAGERVVVPTIMLLLALGAGIWLRGTFALVQPSMLPLLR